VATPHHPARSRPRPRAVPEARDPLGLAVFPSELGWIALAGRGAVLEALTFGHASPREAVAALGRQCEATAAQAWKTPLVERLARYARGAREDFSDVAIAPFWRTEFQARVAAHCRRIPYGQTCSYAELAARAGSPGAARAVGSVMRSNRVPLIIPCHRVVGSGGALGGYSGAEGLATKRRLLVLEGALRGPG
jgi:methylated-DNA-[protein]-cysteine S-methyltransferase